MKNNIKKLIALSFVLGFFVSYNLVGAVGAPIFVSASASNITSTSAVLHGVVNPNGNNTTAWYRVQNGAQQLGYQNIGSGNSNVTLTNYTLSGLTPNTTYFFSVVADNDYGTTFGNWISFTTTSSGGGCNSGCNPPPPPSLPSVDLSASNTNLPYGGSTNISWYVSNATSCNGTGGSNGWAGYKNPNGGNWNTGALYSTTTFSITCSNASGSDSDSVTVYVAPQPYNPPPPPASPTVNLNANPMSISYGSSSTLSWNSTNATSCNGTGGSNGWAGYKNTSGTFNTGTLTSTTTYNITCTGNGGSASDSVTIYVSGQPYNPPTNLPTVSLWSGSSNVAYGGNTTLSWNTSYATSCTGSEGTNGWAGYKGLNGSFNTGSLYQNVTYVLTCSNSSGSASDSVTISVGSNNNNNNEIPTVTTNPATNIDDNSATLHGYVNSNGGNTTVYFEWGPNSSMNNETTDQYLGNTSGSNFTYGLNNLSSNQTYYFRAVAKNVNGQNVYGIIRTFDTCDNDNNCDEDNCSGSSCGKPEVTTNSATNIGTNSVTLNGELEEINDNEAKVWFEYSDDRDEVEDGDGEDTNKEDMDDEDDFSDHISGLRTNTTYYFRAVARNDNGTDYGNIRSFRTSTGGNVNSCSSTNCAPQAITTLATNIGSSSARLNGLGIINGNTISTGYFEWGTSSFLGSSTPSNTIGIGGSNPYSFSLFGLSPSTTYFYRAVVVNQYGTSRGDIATFRTNTGGSVAGSSTTVVRNTTVVSNEYSGTARPSLVFLDVDRDDEIIRIGEVIDYTIDYRNISKEDLYNVILQIHLPKELRFVDTSRGYFSEENNTVVVNIGDLNIGESGSVVVTAEVTADAELGKVVVVAANLAYTIVRNENQEEVFAYSKNTIDDSRVNLGGLALFGGGFLPGTLIGWLILLLIILLILLLAKRAYDRTTPRTVNNYHGHGAPSGEHINNLPH